MIPAWSVQPFAQRLEESALGTAIAESRYAFPIIEGTHLLSLAVSVGLIVLIDLRLLGIVLPQVPAHRLVTQLRPYALSGYGLIVISGVLLLWSEATSVIESPAWAFKWLFMGLAGVNALYFELVLSHQAGFRGDDLAIPRRIKVAGAASLGLWALVIGCGRLIAYLPSWH